MVRLEVKQNCVRERTVSAEKGQGMRRAFSKWLQRLRPMFKRLPVSLQWPTSHISPRGRPRVRPGASGFALQAPHSERWLVFSVPESLLDSRSPADAQAPPSRVTR